MNNEYDPIGEYEVMRYKKFYKILIIVSFKKDMRTTDKEFDISLNR